MAKLPPPTPPSLFRQPRLPAGPLVIAAAASLSALSTAVSGLLAAPPAGAAPPVAAPQTLYSLETKCALQGAAPVVCTVEAIDEGGATLYRHRIGNSVQSVRVTADPSRMEMWDSASRSWRHLRSAEARFSTNTVCFNDRELCVVNANYLNSLLEDRPDLRGRDYVRAHFGPNGRVDLLCYDGGCDLLAQRGMGVKP
jgi:hypothetical protein